VLFPHYRVESDLPRTGKKFEVTNCDFKTWYRDDERHKLAIDIASLANAFGGVLLTGAKDEREELVRYAPKTKKEAVELRARANEVAAKNCVPAPRVEPHVIRKGKGYVVAIEVYGSADQPIGVKTTEPHAYKFPVRESTHTNYMTPGELGKIMVPEIRAVAIQLSHIPPDERAVTIRWKDATTGSNAVTLVGVEPNLLLAMFTYGGGGSKLDLPLNQIEAVEPRYEGGARKWQITIQGMILDRGGGKFYWQKVRY
jgi:hypothetical protein